MHPLDRSRDDCNDDDADDDSLLTGPGVVLKKPQPAVRMSLKPEHYDSGQDTLAPSWIIVTLGVCQTTMLYT